jgi:Tfp pilus assembly protein PilX
MPKKDKKSNCLAKGSAIVYALIIMTIVAILLTSILQYVVSQMKFNINRVERERAFQIAEAGVYYYRWFLAHETAGMTAAQLKAFWQNEAPGGTRNYATVEYKDPETNVGIGTYQIKVSKPDPSSTIVTAEVTGRTYQEPNAKRIVQARFRRPSWSEYMYLVDAFVNFGTGATVYGKIHSNTGVRFDGVAYNSVTNYQPSFDEPTSGHRNGLDFGVHTHVAPADPVAPNYPWPNGTVPNRPDVFKGGRQFPVPKVSFNGVLTDLDFMEGEAARVFGGTGDVFARRIILKTDGNFDVCRVRAVGTGYDSGSLALATSSAYRNNTNTGNCSSCSGACLSTYPIPQDGIIFVKNNVWVEGTVNNKRITIVAANTDSALSNIYVGINNLRYTNHDGQDVIGLVAKNNVQIVQDCQNNLILDSALLAQSGKVLRSDYSDHKSSLTINGAIASSLQPGFNWGTDGFTTRTYNFDNNLLYFPPPYFPTGTEYSIDLWDEL